MCGDIMAFKINQFQQMNLFDPLYSMSERNKRFLQKSWANDFANIVFPAINEERFSVLYSDNAATAFGAYKANSHATIFPYSSFTRCAPNTWYASVTFP